MTDRFLASAVRGVQTYNFRCKVFTVLIARYLYLAGKNVALEPQTVNVRHQVRGNPDGVLPGNDAGSKCKDCIDFGAGFCFNRAHTCFYKSRLVDADLAGVSAAFLQFSPVSEPGRDQEGAGV